MVRPTLDEFRSLARTHTVIPVWRELLADLTTPVAAFTRLVGDGTGFLLESVEHGEARWSRWSFVGRNPLATLTARGLDVEVTGARARHRAPRPGASSPPSRPCWPSGTPPRCPTCPRCTAGSLGYLGYDVVREVEHLPDVPKDDQGHADAVVSVIGQLAAYDHWRQRVVLIENVVAPPERVRRRPGPALRVGRRPPRRAGRRRRPAGRRAAGRAARRPTRPLPEVRSTMGSDLYAPGGRGGPRAHPGRRHLPGRAVAAVRLRPRRRPLRPVPGAAPGQPEPVHVLRPPTGADAWWEPRPSRWCAWPTGGSSPGPSPAPAAGAPPTRRTPAWRASCASTPRRSPSTSCWSTWPATTWAGSCGSAPSRSRSTSRSSATATSCT